LTAGQFGKTAGVSQRNKLEDLGHRVFAIHADVFGPGLWGSRNGPTVLMCGLANEKVQRFTVQSLK